MSNGNQKQQTSWRIYSNIIKCLDEDHNKAGLPTTPAMANFILKKYMDGEVISRKSILGK